MNSYRKARPPRKPSGSARQRRAAKAPTGRSGSPAIEGALRRNPELRAFKKRLGERLWQDQVAFAQERWNMVHRVEREIASGSYPSKAAESCGVSHETFMRWRAACAKDGFAGLITIKKAALAEDAAVLSERQFRRRQAAGFVKWAGSKRSVISVLLHNVPRDYTTYCEPMVGAGTLFAHLEPIRATLGDTNHELMTCYQVLQTNIDGLCAELSKHRNTYKHFIRVRAWDPRELTPVQRAARFIYLNKTCFNGLYRVNRRGTFNVPYGRQRYANFLNFDILHEWSQRLRQTNLREDHYRRTLARARARAFVYLDPPYFAEGVTQTHHNRYNLEVFGLAEHEELAEYFRDLDRRGCHVLLSNSNHPRVRQLYAGFDQLELQTRRQISQKGTKRNGFSELLISNRKLQLPPKIRTHREKA